MTCRLDEIREISVAQLPNGSHIVYAVANTDYEGNDQIFYKVVGSTIDLQSGEWQRVPHDIK